MPSSPGEDELSGGFNRPAPGYERKVDRIPQPGEFNRKRRRQPLQVADTHARRHRRPGENVFGKQQFNLEPGEHKPAKEARNQQERQHRREDQEEKVVSGDKCTSAGGEQSDDE